MERLVYIDGKLLPESKAKISVFDHGFLYGDGVFEGIRVYSGLIFRLDQHLDRLYESAHTVLLKIPMMRKELGQAIIKTLKANRQKDAYIRLVVSRGVGDLGLDPNKCKTPTIVIITNSITLYPSKLYEDGLKIITVPTVRNIPEALNPQLKTLNYLNNILAKIEASNSGFVEALMLNHQGYVAECTGDNIFMVKRGVVTTPPVYVGALPGITRGAIIDLITKPGLVKTGNLPKKFEERLLTRHDLYNADEVFLTGTAAELIPVVEIDGRMIGSGEPGPVTRSLMKGFRELTRKDGVKYAV
ncbi:MAG: branched-chain-amino-acid transaminase [Candidatus Omnitrophica bacterium]|nr:branched-chain-amino-acid transaminase [Candidatus Omnitrophota bacterium]